MPIHDLGYRPWDGQLCPEITRWSVIAQTGIKLAWKSRWLRRMVLVAWVPALYMGVAIFLFEQSASRPELSREAAGIFRELGGKQGAMIYKAAIEAEPGEARHQIWGWLLLLFFRYPQGLLMALVVGHVAPGLISQDVRTRAVLLYFSRPITLVEYILGKLAIVCAYVALITTVPGISLYLFGVLMSPDLGVVSYTWDFLPRILAASVVLMVPTTVLALALSSATTRSYHASFAWFAIWGVGIVTYYSLKGVLGLQFDERWALVSLYHTLGKVQAWIFEPGASATELLPYLLLLAGVSVISLTAIFYRVRACLRV